MQVVQFRKGDRVRFRLGVRSVQGTVTEDRGPIGVNGRRLYRVEFQDDPSSPSHIELPAEELQSVPRTAVSR